MKLTNPEKVGLSPERLARINTTMQRYIDQHKFAGIVTLVARRGKLVHLESFGHQSIENGTPMQTDTLFRIYSMTKPITTVAAMMLWEEGHFQLGDPVAKFIPAFGESKVFAKSGFAGPELVPQSSPMTIRQLMSHTAGLSYGFLFDSPVEEMYRQLRTTAPVDPTSAEVIEKYATLPLIQQPGQGWRYSIATDVLGRIVEVIAGCTLRDFFLERILKPLKMDDTDYYVTSKKIGRLATVYSPTPTGGLTPLGPPMLSDATVLPCNHPGGHGLFSTISDYLRFCQMMLNGGELDGSRLLGRKTVELMTRNHLDPNMLPIEKSFNMDGRGFGLGFSVVVDPAQHRLPLSEGTYAWGGAANTKFWIDPKEELIGILMAQFMPSDTYPLGDDFKVAVYQAIVD